MEILVCVKRVPQVGGKIVVTADGQDVDTRMSGFTVSPHEECAVEEAVQIIERLGGSVTVLTLGPPEAAEQLRDMLALGANRAVLLETDGREWGPIATAEAIVAAARAGPTAGRATTCCCSATRRPTPATTRCGVRVAHALGCPASPASRHRDHRRHRAAGQAGVPGRGGDLRLRAARGDQRQGGHQPAPVPVAARAAAGQAGGIERPQPQWQPEGLRKRALRVPETERHQAEISAPGTDAVPALVALLDELGVLP